ncbi:MAG: transcriptional repressor [Muribaculum sp.]|nr:transcriptional repressor [Muribaculum sp.]
MTLIQTLENSGIKATSNRILVFRTLADATSPMSLIELETLLETLDRSSIQRVLTLLSDHGLVHVMEDGRGVAKYEVCHSIDGHHTNDDHHAHFYCEKCNKVFCLEDICIPRVPVPSGFEVTGVNFMLKGLCPECHSKA